MLLLMQYNPEKNAETAIKLTDTMKFVGYRQQDCATGTAPYMRCYRLLKKKRDAAQVAAVPKDR